MKFDLFFYRHELGIYTQLCAFFLVENTDVRYIFGCINEMYGDCLCRVVFQKVPKFADSSREV